MSSSAQAPPAPAERAPPLAAARAWVAAHPGLILATLVVLVAVVAARPLCRARGVWPLASKQKGAAAAASAGEAAAAGGAAAPADPEVARLVAAINSA